MLSSLPRYRALFSPLTLFFSHLPRPHLEIANMSVRRTQAIGLFSIILLALGLRYLLQTSGGAKITDWVDPKDKSGEFKRGQSAFRTFISTEPGAKHPPEKDRYHLYVSYACP